MPEYAGICVNIAEYAGMCMNIPEYARVAFILHVHIVIPCLL